MLWWILLAITICICLKIYDYQRYWQKMNVPYLKPIPFLGNSAPFILRRKTITDWLVDLYNSRGGRYFGFYTFLQPTLLIKDLNLIRQIGIKDFDHFVDHKTFVDEDIDPLFGKNLFTLRGQKWRIMRSTLSPAFTGSKMRSMFVLISECAAQFTDYFATKVDSNVPLTIEMKDTFSRFTNDVIASTAFGIKCDSLREYNNEFYLMGKRATDFSGLRALKFFGYSISAPLMKLFRIKIFDTTAGNFFREIIVNNIATREREGIIRPDMINLLIEARKGQLKYEESVKSDAGFATVEESDVGKQVRPKLDLTDDDMTAQAIIFFNAGFDTISIALCHMSYELALNPEIQTRLQNEIDDTLKECKGTITYDAVLNMKYLDMVMSETLRKWPPAIAIDRVCTDSYTIHPENENELPVPLQKSDPVWVPIYAIHRDPQYYPNPDKFDPERFNDENKANIKPFSYIPFGVGPRNCIGSRFALLEGKTVMVHFLSKFSFMIVEKSQVPLKLNKTQFNLNAEKGFWLGLKKRI